jgi:hypothetical protein
MRFERGIKERERDLDLSYNIFNPIFQMNIAKICFRTKKRRGEEKNDKFV